MGRAYTQRLDPDFRRDDERFVIPAQAGIQCTDGSGCVCLGSGFRRDDGCSAVHLRAAAQSSGVSVCIDSAWISSRMRSPSALYTS